jgi:hypothetical protein
MVMMVIFYTEWTEFLRIHRIFAWGDGFFNRESGMMLAWVLAR